MHDETTPAEAMALAFEQGWLMAAEWAKRDDLPHDVGSPAYVRERDARLAEIPALRGSGAQGGVTDEVVERAIAIYFGPANWPDDVEDPELCRNDMRAALEAVWPVTFTTDGSSEAQYIADSEHLNCPTCGGSGHVDDVQEQQATTCAGCGEHKHTPLRIDAMGGYVCLTCIDKRLTGLLKSDQAQQDAIVGYVAPDTADEIVRHGGAVSIGTYSRRYGRTMPVYARPSVQAQQGEAVGYSKTRDLQRLSIQRSEPAYNFASVMIVNRPGADGYNVPLYAHADHPQQASVPDPSRWEIGFRNIVTALVGPHVEFEISDIVSRVESLAMNKQQASVPAGWVLVPKHAVEWFWKYRPASCMKAGLPVLAAAPQPKVSAPGPWGMLEMNDPVSGDLAELPTSMEGKRVRLVVDDD